MRGVGSGGRWEGEGWYWLLETSWKTTMVVVVVLLMPVDGEARKECHFRSHDTNGPAGHFALFLFSARRARPDLSTPRRFAFSLFLINARHYKSVTNERNGRQMNSWMDGWMNEWTDKRPYFSTFVNEFVVRSAPGNFGVHLHPRTIGSRNIIRRFGLLTTSECRLRRYFLSSAV